MANHPLFVASDHAGFELKARLVREVNLAPFGREWSDLGTHSKDSVDYPTYAQDLCKKIKNTFSHQERLNPCGVLICGSGVGVSISANRFAGIRAALCWSEEVASLSRQHNAANVLCLGERLVSAELAIKILNAWLSTGFEGGRHLRRVDLIDL